MRGFVKIGNIKPVQRALQNYAKAYDYVIDQLDLWIAELEDDFKPTLLQRMHGIKTLKGVYLRADTHCTYREWIHIYKTAYMEDFDALVDKLEVFDVYGPYIKQENFKSLKDLYSAGGELNIGEDLAHFIIEFADFSYDYKDKEDFKEQA